MRSWRGSGRDCYQAADADVMALPPIGMSTATAVNEEEGMAPFEAIVSTNHQVHIHLTGSGTGSTGMATSSSPLWSPGIRILLRRRWKFLAVGVPFPETPMHASRKPEVNRQQSTLCQTARISSSPHPAPSDGHL